MIINSNTKIFRTIIQAAAVLCLLFPVAVGIHDLRLPLIEFSLALLVSGMILMHAHYLRRHHYFRALAGTFALSAAEALCLAEGWSDEMLFLLALLQAALLVCLSSAKRWMLVKSIFVHEEKEIPEAKGSMMEALYERVVDIMEHDKPFLDFNFSLQELASIVLTNKTYLSKTINVMSGKNFRKFVNAYRVKEIVNIFNSSSSLRIGDIYAKVGFNSFATFNLAFKAEMGCTPGEYIQQLKLARARPIGEGLLIFPKESF